VDWGPPMREVVLGLQERPCFANSREVELLPLGEESIMEWRRWRFYRARSLHPHMLMGGGVEIDMVHSAQRLSSHACGQPLELPLGQQRLRQS